MPRVRNTRSTAIYWLYDIRPETIALGWRDGCPFYCGKTVQTLVERLRDHKFTSLKHPDRRISKWITACGGDIRIELKEQVGTAESWSNAERRWISLLRSLVPVCANTTNGGEGTPGNVHTLEARMKIAASKIGVRRSEETCAKMSIARKGKPIKTPRSPEWCARISAAKMGGKHTDEARAKMSAAKKGKPSTNKGRKFSEQARTNMRIAALRRWHGQGVA